MNVETITDDTISGGALLFGRVLDGKGGGREIAWEEAQGWEPQAEGEVLWLHIRRMVQGVDLWLEEEFGMPEPTATLLTSDDTRPRAFREGEALVATLRSINFNPGAEPEDMVSMQLWSDGKRVLTLRRHPLQTPRELRDEIDAGLGPMDAGALISNLVEVMITKMSSSIIDMNEHIDMLEDAELSSQDSEAMLRKIASIRHNCLALKRHMSPQHEALERISRDAPLWFEDHDRREIAESIARLRRYLDDLDISKESAVVLMDDIRGRTIARSERTTYVLTIVAAIFLPLTFLTGLLGINVGGIPGAANPTGFYVVTGLCFAILLVMLLLFRKWKWL